MTRPADAETADDERVLLVVHKHWAALVIDAWAFLVTGGAVCAILIIFRGFALSTADIITRATVTFLVPLAFLTLWTMLTFVWTNYYLDMFVVTDRRIFYTSQINFVQRTIQAWYIADLLHANVLFTNLFESFFNYGTLEVTTRDDPEAAYVTGIPDPEYVSAVILQQDDRFGALKETARKQHELLHFLSHEVKGHLAKSKAAFAAIAEGDYGAVSDPVKSLASEGFKDSQKGVETVMNILDGSILSGGATVGGSAIQYDKKPFDFAESVRRVFDDLRTLAERKGIAMSVSAGGPYVVIGDQHKIEQHVIRNFLDNAIRYTFAGQIDITVSSQNGAVRLAVANTGIGITGADTQRLFTEGGHGEHSRATNPESTGYGLYIAKQVVEAHEGKVWAHSSGPGTGSTFYAELPIAKVVPTLAPV